MNDRGERSRVTQYDVAARAGVSRAVVSYVLNNGPRGVSEGARQRVLAAIEELGYHPNKHAQRLKQGGDGVRNAIGIVAGGQSYNALKRPYYNAVMAGIFDHAYQLNQHIRFFSFFNALKDPVFFSKNIHPDEISALILLLPRMITSTPGHEPVLDRLIERIGNVVCLEESIKGLPAIILDRAAAARMAVEHLIGLGHERIAFLAIDDERRDGYRQALAAHGLAYDESLVRVLSTVDPSISAYDFTGELFDIVPRPTALFTAHDEAAIGAIAALQDSGLRVPDDVAIVSIDDIDIARLIRPALTTVSVPTILLGEYAVKHLLAVSTGAEPESVVVPVELVVRESCGASKRRQAPHG